MVLLLALFLPLVWARSVSPRDFGANESVSLAQATRNSAAIEKAFAAAGAGGTVVVGAGETYVVMQSAMAGLENATLVLDGRLVVWNTISDWPDVPKGDGANVVLYFANATNLSISGSGVIDGQGYDWWWWAILGGKRKRPHLLRVERCRGLKLSGVTFLNGPGEHINLYNVLDTVVTGINITVDVERIKKLGLSLPTFPLNTDGIDVSGSNILIENSYIKNFDDAIAVKPLNGENGLWAPCSQNMLVQNMTVDFSVGMSIGSVPPHEHVNCVRNITFRDVTFDEAIKAIYVKSNPGDSGSGIIDNILYANISVFSSLWYPIWIGPQQQKQPGTNGTGCSFFYPEDPTCPTNPRVTISNIHILDSTFSNGDTLPGVFLCDPINPCSGIVLDNVVNTGTFRVQNSYACHNADVKSMGTTIPIARCGS